MAASLFLFVESAEERWRGPIVRGHYGMPATADHG